MGKAALTEKALHCHDMRSDLDTHTRLQFALPTKGCHGSTLHLRGRRCGGHGQRRTSRVVWARRQGSRSQPATQRTRRGRTRP